MGDRVAATDGGIVNVPDATEIFPRLYSGPAAIRKAGLDLSVALAGALAAFLVLGPVEAGWAVAWLPAVVVVVRSDLERYIIPDGASLAIAVLGLGRAIGGGFDADLPSCLEAAGRGAVAFAVMWSVAQLFLWRTGRPGLGFGDVKLAAASGIWLSFADQVLALEIAAGAAILLTLLIRRGPRERQAAIPFGAFLAPAAWLVFVVGPSSVRVLAAYG